MIRVLYIADFDPANVCGGHCKALRDIGIDARLAVYTVYRSTPFEGGPSWRAQGFGRHTPGCPETVLDGLADFAAAADVIIWNPSIGQPWSYQELTPRFHDTGTEDFAGIQWKKVIKPSAKQIVYVHGSRNCWHNRATYLAAWHEQGFSVWCSTLDYLSEFAEIRNEMKGHFGPPLFYMPPAVAPFFQDGTPWPLAKLRADSDPLTAVQAPTDAAICHTTEFQQACARAGVPFTVIQRKPHPEAIQLKAKANLGFDHLRGSFSVNSIENMALGLLPIFGLTAKAWRAGEDYFESRFPLSGPMEVQENLPIGDRLAARIKDFRDNPRAHNLAQGQWRKFYQDFLLPEKVTKRFLVPVLERLASP